VPPIFIRLAPMASTVMSSFAAAGGVAMIHRNFRFGHD
jgi:hypothetical protein